MTVINLQGNTPEDLLDGTRKGLDGILGFGCRKTDQLGSTEGEGGGDEDGAETTKPIFPGARVVP